jgi:hypothetical protein
VVTAKPAGYTIGEHYAEAESSRVRFNALLDGGCSVCEWLIAEGRPEELLPRG